MKRFLFLAMVTLSLSYCIFESDSEESVDTPILGSWNVVTDFSPKYKKFYTFTFNSNSTFQVEWHQYAFNTDTVISDVPKTTTGSFVHDRASDIVTLDFKGSTDFQRTKEQFKITIVDDTLMMQNGLKYLLSASGDRYQATIEYVRDSSEVNTVQFKNIVSQLFFDSASIRVIKYDDLGELIASTSCPIDSSKIACTSAVEINGSEILSLVDGIFLTQSDKYVKYTSHFKGIKHATTP